MTNSQRYQSHTSCSLHKLKSPEPVKNHDIMNNYSHEKRDENSHYLDQFYAKMCEAMGIEPNSQEDPYFMYNTLMTQLDVHLENYLIHLPEFQGYRCLENPFKFEIKTMYKCLKNNHEEDVNIQSEYGLVVPITHHGQDLKEAILSINSPKDQKYLCYHCGLQNMVCKLVDIK